MEIVCKGIKDGRLDDIYGCKGTEFLYGHLPARSFPLEINGAPSGTASYAVIFDDPDSVPVCGFKWIHWLVSGLRKNSLPEDASRTCSDIVQGVNSWYQNGLDDRIRASCYGGPYPPDREHVYVITVLALDFIPVLKTGFTYDELMKVTKGHVLASASVKGAYSPRNA